MYLLYSKVGQGIVVKYKRDSIFCVCVYFVSLFVSALFCFCVVVVVL